MFWGTYALRIMLYLFIGWLLVKASIDLKKWKATRYLCSIHLWFSLTLAALLFVLRHTEDC